MIEINLLPKGYRKKQVSFSFGKSSFYVIGAAAGIVLMLVSVTIYQMSQIASLDENMQKARQRAAMLEKDIQLVDGLTEVKEKISARMAAVERLDSHRSAWVRIMEDLGRNVPEFVWLGRFTELQPKVDSAAQKQKTSATFGNTQPQAPDSQATPKPQPNPNEPKVMPVEVEGYAFTLNALASFMINTMRSDYFDEVELKSTKEITLGDSRAYNFVLACNLHYLSEEELRGLIAQVEESAPDENDTRHKSLN